MHIVADVFKYALPARSAFWLLAFCTNVLARKGRAFKVSTGKKGPGRVEDGSGGSWWCGPQAARRLDSTGMTDEVGTHGTQASKYHLGYQRAAVASKRRPCRLFSSSEETLT